MPAGWAITSTRGGPAPAHWAVEREGERTIFSLAEPETPIRDDIFNIAWLPDTRFADVDLSAEVRANRGRRDQGGGLLWRAVDSDNYYVARYNPREGNFRIYCVLDGVRFELASAENLAIAAGEWFTVGIVHRGEEIEGHLNGRLLLRVRDTRLRGAGIVGLWTKSDAATSFDNFQVQEL
jgi:hypothetical protein